MSYDTHPAVAEVSAARLARSEGRCAGYLSRIDAARAEGPARDGVGWPDLADGVAACAGEERDRLVHGGGPSIGIFTAYNAGSRPTSLTSPTRRSSVESSSRRTGWRR
jgi:hypothetical protein